jgi:hypothetical protein
MQLLNVLVALTGDRNNMVPKHGITPAELLLLQQLHGADAVLQIEPVGDVERTPLAEIERLKTLYPQKDLIQNIWRDWPADRFPLRLDALMLNPALLKPVEASAPYAVSAKVA